MNLVKKASKCHTYIISCIQRHCSLFLITFFYVSYVPFEVANVPKFTVRRNSYFDWAINAFHMCFPILTWRRTLWIMIFFTMILPPVLKVNIAPRDRVHEQSKKSSKVPKLSGESKCERISTLGFVVQFVIKVLSQKKPSHGQFSTTPYFSRKTFWEKTVREVKKKSILTRKRQKWCSWLTRSIIMI